MWIFSFLGFFSATLAEGTGNDKKKNPLIKVRARVKEDLVKLQAYMRRLAQEGIIAAPPDGEWPIIHEDLRADYYWRIFMPRNIWAKIVNQLTLETDYGNFKAAVHGEHDRDSAYMAVWSVMNRLQTDRVLGDRIARDQQAGNYPKPLTFDEVKDFTQDELDAADRIIKDAKRGGRKGKKHE